MRLLAATALALLAPTLSARAGEVPVPLQTRDLVAFLGTPTRPERAWQAWDEVRVREVVHALRLATALGMTGGQGALGPLTELLRDRDETVRVAAMRSIGRVGLRSEKLVDRLRDALRWRQDEELRAALLALGHVGDGRDVDTLLEYMLADDPALALTAYQALVRLSGKTLPPVQARWSYWWRTARQRGEAAILDGVIALEEQPDGPLADAHRQRLQDAAWIQIDQVEAHLRRWLATSNDALRAHAMRLAPHLGLAELGPRIERARDLQRDGTPLALLADEALEVLGLRLPPAPPVPEPTPPAAPAPPVRPVAAPDAQGARGATAEAGATGSGTEPPPGLPRLLAAWLEGMVAPGPSR